MSARYTKELYLSWDDIQTACAHLAERLVDERRSFDRILAITRGGLFPAGIFARELDIRQVDAIGIDTYDGQQIKDRAEIIKPCQPEFLENTLIIDDLVDTGTTLKELQKHTKNCYFITVFAKPKGLNLVDMYHREVAQETWVRFPWDTRRQYIEPLVRKI